MSLKLNNNYKRALKGTNYGSPDLDHVELGGTHCCGLDELDFEGLQCFGQDDQFLDTDALDWERPKYFRELVAKNIKQVMSHNDNRVVFCGLPTRVGSNSQYSIEIYEEHRKVLNHFGFKELAEPYKNANSGNTIVVLAGQMP